MLFIQIPWTRLTYGINIGIGWKPTPVVFVQLIDKAQLLTRDEMLMRDMWAVSLQGRRVVLNWSHWSRYTPA